MTRIRGEVSFQGDVSSLEGAAVYVRVLDVSRADAAALTVAEYSVSALPHGADTSCPIPFDIPLDRPDTGRSYVLTAHVDLDGDGKVSIGDYVTMESFPIQSEQPTPQLIRVRRVGG